MVWLEIIVIIGIVTCVAMKFYNIGYNECVDDFNEVYDFGEEIKEEEEKTNGNK